jgi:hypothetical protein
MVAPYDWAEDDVTQVAVHLVATPFELNLALAFLCADGAPALVRELGLKWTRTIRGAL